MVAPDAPSAVLDGADEAQLVARAKNGCPAAIEQLVGRYESRVFRLARNITSNQEDTEEVVQNAFVKAFLSLSRFRGDSCFYTWLVRIAVNEALMKIRGRRFREVSIDEQRYSQEELRRILETAISKLDPGYRIVFHLRDIEGLSPKETAQTLRLSLATVKSRVRRARLKLRDSLDAYFRPKKGKRRSPALATSDVRSSSLRQL
jgi:RNA polymerase sigma-70 factor (ECF subfamily)